LISISPASDRQKVAAITLLAECAGYTGMIGGQVMDLAAENAEVNLETIQQIYKGKTAALMCAAVGLGCIASGHFEGDVFSSLSIYAEEIGIAFQIQDDILDVYGTYALGKPIGSDEKNGKSTYLSFMTHEEAMAEARARTSRAKKAIQDIPGSDMLIVLADYLLDRNK
jgi:geranylgeranyl pyrophosphate synthase